MASSILSKGEGGGELESVEGGNVAIGNGGGSGGGSTFSNPTGAAEDPLITFSTNRFPMDSGVKGKAGLPFGCVIRPFAPHESCGLEGFNGVPLADDIARCGKCFAYINPLVSLEVNHRRWRCPFCFHDRNPLTSNRYHNAIHAGTLASLPELQHKVMEFVIDKPPTTPATETPQLQTSGVFLAIVDLSNNDKQYLELVKNGLSALVEALSPSAFFGLITFSDRIGIHDLRSPIPHAKHLRIPSKGEDFALTISEVLHISSFFVKKETYELNISSTIEALSHFVTESGVGKCGFGSAIASVLDYLSNSEDNLNIRTLVFLNNIPNYGFGSLVPEKNNTSTPTQNAPAVDPSLVISSTQEPIVESDDVNLNPTSTFYRELSSKAASAGICIDLAILSSREVGLPSLKFLSANTGGNIMLYTLSNEVTLAQDIFRQYGKPQAFHGLLRIRTSTEFKVSNWFGHMAPDAKYENLYHLQGCDQWKTVAFDFEFTTPAGFARNALRPPTIQMAFAYTYVPSANDVNSQRAHRRLRVYTVKLEATDSVQEVYLSANGETIMNLLTHKIIRSALQEGVVEAKALLQDWIVISLTHYNEEIIRQLKRRARATGETTPPFRPDVTFSKAPNLALLPRCVLGLLKNPLLNLTAPSPSSPSLSSTSSSSSLSSSSLTSSPLSTTHTTNSADYWTFLQSLYTGLDPHSLRLAYYPVLQLLETPQSLGSQLAPLSSQEVRTSPNANVLFYDSYHLLYVFYTHQAVSQQLAFPPPRDSNLRHLLNEAKRDRLLTPQQLIAKSEPKEEQFLDSLMIEDDDTVHGTSLKSLQEAWEASVAKYIGNL